jgi:hypothetical protein
MDGKILRTNRSEVDQLIHDSWQNRRQCPHPAVEKMIMAPFIGVAARAHVAAKTEFPADARRRRDRSKFQHANRL